MDEIKIENNLNVVCHGCLSNDRQTSALGEYLDTFASVIGSSRQNFIYSPEDMKFCWECIAILKKFKSFQMQLNKAQDVLMQMLYELNYNPMTLSKLTTIKKYYYDNDYQHLYKKKKHKKEIDTSYNIHLPDTNMTLIDTNMANIDKNMSNIDKNVSNDEKIPIIDTTMELLIPIENSIKEENYDYESFVDNCDVDDMSNVEDTNIDDVSNNENNTSNIDNSMSNIDNNLSNIDNNMSNTDKSKRKRAKRRKLVKSRDNSVSYYKQYAKLIEREKIDWGKVENYFTMIEFSEREMEEHFLSKERKFSECTRFEYKCVECELGYMRSFDLKRHNNLNHHNPADPIKCTVCDTNHPTLESLESHWLEHTPVAKCRLCSDVCRPRGMKNHLNYAHTSKYACRFCHLTFGKILHFSEHYKKMHQNYICDYCNQSCKSKILVAKHIRTHHTTFTCNQCDRHYPNYRRYKRHLTEMHPNKYKERPELAYCVECDRQYCSVSKYKKHLKVSPKHTEIKRILLPCPDCGKIFKRKNYLNNHYNLYHAKKSKHYCEICDKFFANAYGLRKHKTHVHLKVSRVKDKMCDLCGRGFATNRILQNHRRTHTGERPYQCPFCAAAFTQKQAMHSHCRTQHKDIK